MSTHRDSHRWQFEELAFLVEQGEREEADALFQKLVRLGHEIADPLINYTVGQPAHARLAVLLELLGKVGGARAAPVLMRFLEAEAPELRRQAAVGLGWLRARAALEALDDLEADDPDEDVRREARVAIEEILREFPSLRSRCRRHEPLQLEQRVQEDSADEIARTVRPSVENRRRLAGIFPRLLAQRFDTAPMWIGPGGVVRFIVARDARADPLEALRRLTGREVELHAWPRRELKEWMLEFYDRGDDDWLQVGAELTPEAIEEISAIVLEGVDADEPHPPLPDCSDATEAVQSFLSICALRRYASVLVEEPAEDRGMRMAAADLDGRRNELTPPSPGLQAGFARALLLLAGLETPAGGWDFLQGRHPPRRGAIRREDSNIARVFEIVVRRDTAGGRNVLILDFSGGGGSQGA